MTSLERAAKIIKNDIQHEWLPDVFSQIVILSSDLLPSFSEFASLLLLSSDFIIVSSREGSWSWTVCRCICLESVCCLLGSSLIGGQLSVALEKYAFGSLRLHR